VSFGHPTHHCGKQLTISESDPTPDLPTSPPQTHELPTRPARSEYEFQVETNKRKDEVEPGLTQFRGKRRLHIRQLEDIRKKRIMVMERNDKLSADVEKLRQQWGELEREKAALLEAQQRWEKKMTAQEKVVHKDDVIAQKYHDYLALDEEVLVLDDSEDEDGDQVMFDWQEQRQGGVEEEQAQQSVEQ